jgi:stearoyl-CoA desaturase (delta-9 desaturase)
VGWGDVALFFGMYIPISLGVTVGLHRMLTHRSFKPNPAVEAVFLILGSMAIQGAVLGWAADHLKHHALSDKEGDPHSPVATAGGSFWHSHLGWLFDRRHADPQVYCRHLMKDPVIRFVDRTFLLWVVIGLVIPFLIGGWQGFLWGGLVRVFFVHHVTWSVNSVCHTFGKKAYDTTDRSRNQWTVGLMGLGEGWHNNHHAFPRSAIHGMDRFQFDFSGQVISALEKVGLVKEVYRVPTDLRARKRLDGLLAFPSQVNKAA